jgi:mannose-1-phosphate guanylyltransferase/mannose-6-phosphate isomerase
MKYCTERLGCADDEILFVSPSDHVIRPVEKFLACIRRAEEAAAKGYIVTFGIKPSRPETGYGYIKARSRQSGVSSKEYFEVERFTEKPDAVTAVKYVSEGNYYWNSGMFAFSIGTMMGELEAHAPDIRRMMDLNYDEFLSKFDQMPDVSIDYAVAEKSHKMAVMPLDLYWNDIGSWDSLYDELDKDEGGNVRIGDVITVDTKNALVIGSKRLVSTIGMEDCLVIDTDDALLVAKRGETQRVKEIVDALKKAGRKEAVEHLTTYRPWGSYTILEEGERYKIKKIVVNPSARLSLQKHYHRSEHWVVIKGAAKVTMGEKEFFVHENESAFVPKSALHKLENPGKVPLEIIEIQSGEYVGEDDIVRIDDVYGRHRE